jgi:hypothetical protein
MNKALTIAVFSLIMLFAVAQRDTLNKFNTKGKKQGYWLCYLDDKFKVTDSAKAVYVGFDLYDNGQNLTRIGEMRNFDAEKIVDSVAFTNFKMEHYKLLHGKALFCNKEGSIIAEEVYNYGNPVRMIAYCDYKNFPETVGAPKEIVDFNKLYNGMKGTHYYELRFCSDGHTRKYYFRKGRKKWKAFRIKD